LAEQNRYYITCPHCGQEVLMPIINRSGRKPLNIGVKNICDALRACRDISLAAEKLNCSRGYIYKVLVQHHMTPKGVMETSGQKNERRS